MTKKRSIPECAQVIEGVISELLAPKMLFSKDYYRVTEALEALEIIEKHYYDRDKFLEKIRLYLVEQEKFVEGLMKENDAKR